MWAAMHVPKTHGSSAAQCSTQHRCMGGRVDKDEMEITKEASRGQDARLRDGRGAAAAAPRKWLVRLAASATAGGRESRTLTISQAWAAMALLVSAGGVAASRNDLPSYFHLAFASCPTPPRLPPCGPPAIGLGDAERGERAAGLRKDVGA